ncbi:hypothetical protein F3Y22_tig00014370pilonHSYRG00062 [Hibiscus syriacus]|uniref:Uncharacterized protein n=1 Tax=Hibiscus syriacus TaxID=106335 RepID=A0A6A3BZ44_HIBSY|nr:hypothetical protein F3Y22_tig00014370pilonHSYRG00062 [Hibiscus syriacus]
MPYRVSSFLFTKGHVGAVLAVKGIMDSIAECTRFHVGALPVRYLGLPLASRRLSYSDCEGSDDSARVASVSWERICFPKCEGGLGIKNMFDWNMTQLKSNHSWAWKEVLGLRDDYALVGGLDESYHAKKVWFGLVFYKPVILVGLGFVGVIWRGTIDCMELVLEELRLSSSNFGSRTASNSLCPGLEVCFAVLPKVSSRWCAFIAGSSLFDLDAAVCIFSTTLKIRSIGSPTCMVGLILNGGGR